MIKVLGIIRNLNNFKLYCEDGKLMIFFLRFYDEVSINRLVTKINICYMIL